MATLFISHSSQDKPFARQLRDELHKFGHKTWLDEDQIEIGDEIITSIEMGITGADYVLLVLSPNAVKSRWVEEEWKSQYWQQVGSNTKRLLPLLLKKCEIPLFLKPYRYADFTGSFVDGFRRLLQTINKSEQPTDVHQSHVAANEHAGDICALVTRIQAHEEKLSKLFMESRGLARAIGNKPLEEFCRNEVLGYDARRIREEGLEAPSWRIIEVFISLVGPLNLRHPSLINNASGVFEFMRGSDDYLKAPTLLHHGVAEIERDAARDPDQGVFTTAMRVGDFLDNFENPNLRLPAYIAGTAYSGAINAIRGELTRRLLDL